MKAELTSAHFQLTYRCNLACRFCGQSKGMLASEAQEMPPDKWLELAGELKELADEAGVQPSVFLWGGEPLLYPDFDRLAEELHADGFHLSMVTNGTLLDKHAECVKRCIDTVFISVDGIGAVHDAVRGEGVFARLSDNLKLLAGCRGKLVFLTTVSDCNVKEFAGLPEKFARMGADGVVFQPLMYLNADEIASYREYSCRNFNCDYPELEAWLREEDAEYQQTLGESLDRMRHTEYPVPVKFTPHVYPEGRRDVPHCDAPFRRIHIRHDGETGFCTDYFGFSAGSVKNHSLKDIFYGQRAELFRQAVRDNALSCCNHCPWHLQKLKQQPK